MNLLRSLRHPALWLAVGLLVLTLGGGRLLLTEACLHLSHRDRTAYGDRPIWQTQFDALSAAAGCGLLTYRVTAPNAAERDYTQAGRWVLAGLGFAGALLYLAAARQAAGWLWGPGLPSWRAILVAFVTVQALVVPIAVVGERLAGNASPLAGGAWQAVTSFSSLGWLDPEIGHGRHWLYAMIGLVGALGWPIWLRAVRVTLPARGLVMSLATYLAFLALVALLIATLEQPRGAPRAAQADDARLSAQRFAARYARSAAQVISAAGAGAPTETIMARGVSDGTKFLLAGAVLLGGIGGSPGGGVKWLLFLSAAAGVGVILGRGSAVSSVETVRRCVLAGVAVAGSMLLWAAVVAVGLLAIEASVGSRFQSPPTFADAFLDASSAVGGANLTSGVSETITATSLSGGIRQRADVYQYGMTWLMLAIFIGRVLPVLAVARVAQLHARDLPARVPPLI